MGEMPLGLLFPLGKGLGLRLGDLAVVIGVAELDGAIERRIRTRRDMVLVFEDHRDLEFSRGVALAFVAVPAAQGFIEDPRRGVVLELHFGPLGIPSGVGFVRDATREQQRRGG